MRINYNLTVEDWVNFQEYFRKKKSPLYGCMMPLLTVLLVCNIFFGLYMVFLKETNNYSWLFLICIVMLAYLLFLQTRVRKKLTKTGNELKEKNPDIFGDTSMEFFEEGIEIQTPNNKKFLKWADIEKYDQTKDYVIFFSVKGYAYIVPKRDVKEPDRLQIILDKLPSLRGR